MLVNEPSTVSTEPRVSEAGYGNLSWIPSMWATTRGPLQAEIVVPKEIFLLWETEGPGIPASSPFSQKDAVRQAVPMA